MKDSDLIIISKEQQLKADDLRRSIIDRVIGIEGYYSDDADDSGGKTKYGITAYTTKTFGFNDVKKLTPQHAYMIYQKAYWDKLMLDNIVLISPSVARELFDTKVNLGGSAKYLQRCLNTLNNRQKYYSDLLIDGQIGLKTISALHIYLDKRGKIGEQVLLNMLNSLQGVHYISLCERRQKDEKFIYGWFKNRVTIC